MKLLVILLVTLIGLLIPSSTICMGCMGICGSSRDCGPGCACVSSGGAGVCADSMVRDGE